MRTLLFVYDFIRQAREFKWPTPAVFTKNNIRLKMMYYIRNNIQTKRFLHVLIFKK